MSTKQIITFTACIDCLHFIEFGITADPDATVEQFNAHAELIEQRFPGQRLWYDGSEESEIDFSWSPCECCGSTLGGSRHRMAGEVIDA